MKISARILAACLSLLTLASFTVAQEQTKTISGGVLNGKATSLPKPVFPPAAAAVGASGAVSVQVLISETGDVLSANAVSGHPLLRAVSVDAALRAKFSPTTLQGKPVKVAGIITYNFVGTLQVARLGFLVSHAERTSTFGRFTTPESLAYQLPGDWTEEKEILRSLKYEPVNVPETKPDGSSGVKPADKKDTPRRDKNRYTIIGDISFSAASAYDDARKLDAASIESVRRLDRRFADRVSVRSNAVWAYELGRILGELVSAVNDRPAFQSTVSKLESHTANASGVTEFSLRKVTEFIAVCKAADLGTESRIEIISSANALSNLRY